ncbi:conserved hypothetical protein, partial [Ricinus communis]
RRHAPEGEWDAEQPRSDRRRQGARRGGPGAEPWQRTDLWWGPDGGGRRARQRRGERPVGGDRVARPADGGDERRGVQHRRGDDLRRWRPELAFGQRAQRERDHRGDGPAGDGRVGPHRQQQRARGRREPAAGSVGAARAGQQGLHQQRRGHAAGGGADRQQRRDHRRAARSAAAVHRHPEPESLSEVAGGRREHDEAFRVPTTGQRDTSQAGAGTCAVVGQGVLGRVVQPLGKRCDGLAGAVRQGLRRRRERVLAGYLQPQAAAALGPISP